MSAVLLNTMEHLDLPMLLPANHALVGGHHIVATENQTLPKDLQKFADGADAGLVVVSQGDNQREVGMDKFYANLMDIFRERPEYRRVKEAKIMDYETGRKLAQGKDFELNDGEINCTMNI